MFASSVYLEKDLVRGSKNLKFMTCESMLVFQLFFNYITITFVLLFLKTKNLQLKSSFRVMTGCNLVNMI